MAKQILIADDEVHIRSILSLKLRGAGFIVSLAEDGLQALEMARENQPDLLITDYQMPRLSGLELCQRMRGFAPQLPIIMLTARGYHLRPEEIKRNGIMRLLSKPFSPRHLVTAVQEVVQCAAATAA